MGEAVEAVVGDIIACKAAPEAIKTVIKLAASELTAEAHLAKIVFESVIHIPHIIDDGKKVVTDFKAGQFEQMGKDVGDILVTIHLISFALAGEKEETFERYSFIGEDKKKIIQTDLENATDFLKGVVTTHDGSDDATNIAECITKVGSSISQIDAAAALLVQPPFVNIKGFIGIGNGANQLKLEVEMCSVVPFAIGDVIEEFSFRLTTLTDDKPEIL
jgi:hypothetical protein